MAKDSKEERVSRLPWTRRFTSRPGQEPRGWEPPAWPRLGGQLGRVDGSYRKLKRRELIAVLVFPFLIIVLIVIAAVLFRP